MKSFLVGYEGKRLICMSGRYWAMHLAVIFDASR